MASRSEKLTAAVAAALIGLSFLNRLYRASSRNDLPMLSLEALEAIWLYWIGMSIAAIGLTAYWIFEKAKEQQPIVAHRFKFQMQPTLPLQPSEPRAFLAHARFPALGGVESPLAYPFALWILLFLAIAITSCARTGELGEARAWATLQGVNSIYAERVDARAPIVVRNAIESGFDVAGFRSNSIEFKYAWVLLDDHANGVKTFPPSVGPVVRCVEVKVLISREKVSDEVSSYLRKVCA